MREDKVFTTQNKLFFYSMNDDEYQERRKELVSGQARKRSGIYPFLMGVFIVMIIVNVAMLAINNT